MRSSVVAVAALVGAALLVDRIHASGPLRIPTPLDRDVGLGDVVKGAASAVGIDQRPGCGCAARQAALNRVVVLGGRGS